MTPKLPSSCVPLLLCSLFALPRVGGGAPPVILDPAFLPPRADGYYTFAKPMPDGRLIVGGAFRQIGGLSQSYLARLNRDGAVDADFRPDIDWKPLSNDDPVEGADLQPDGRWLIRGGFFAVNGVPRNRLARLNADGSLDQTFDIGTGPGGSSPSIFTLARQPDGKVLVGGGFTSFNGVPRNRVVRLHSNGSVDLDFNPGTGAGGPDSSVNSIALEETGRVILTGSFITFSGSPRSGIARLDEHGSLVPDYSPTVRAEFSPLVQGFLQADGKLLIRGFFTNVNGHARQNLARLLPDGTLDTAFAPSLGSGTVSSSIPLPDGTVLASGTLNFLDGSSTTIARFLHDGMRDPGFFPGDPPDVDSVWGAVAGLPGMVYLWGDFLELAGVPCAGLARIFANSANLRAIDFDAESLVVSEASGAVSVRLRRRGDVSRALTVRLSTTDGTARLDEDYTPHSSLVTFEPGEDATAVAIAVLDDDRAESTETIRLELSMASDLDIIPGIADLRIVDDDRPGSPILRFRPSHGTPSFGRGGTVNRAVLQPDGKVLAYVMYGYASDATQPSPGLVRLNLDGTMDSSFRPAVKEWPQALLADGSVIVGGDYYWGVSTNLVRLTSSGELDPAFKVNVARPGTVSGAAIVGVLPQPDGQLIVFGQFSRINGVPRHQIARVHTNGLVDPNFNAGVGPNRWVTAAALQTDGKILIGGEFISVSGASRRGIARLRSDGVLDPSFNPGTGQAPLYQPDAVYGATAIAVQADGKVLLACQRFTRFNEVALTNLVRLHPDGSVDRTFQAGNHFSPAPTIRALKVQLDGKILVGGSLESCEGLACNNLVRFNPNGSLDREFNSGPREGGDVEGLALGLNQAVYIWGSFHSMGSLPQAGLASLSSGSPGSLKLAITSSGNSVLVIATGAPHTSWRLQSRDVIDGTQSWRTVTDFTLGASPLELSQPADRVGGFYRALWVPY
jgi:uncharacterized delta-60 repeat protein